MKHDETSRVAEPPAKERGLSTSGGLALLEREIADLRERNSHLERRLEEVEMRAELQTRADRILAIPEILDA